MIGVVVVNWGYAEGSAAALASARSRHGVVPVLVDNASPTDPEELVRTRVPDVVLVRRSNNDGFAAGCNDGVAAALATGATHFLLLNNDAVLEPDALDALMEADGRHPGRILAPLVVRADDPHRVWSAGGTLTLPMLRSHHRGLGDLVSAHTRAAPVPWATGCALFASAAVWQRVGPLDEDFFLYLEDVEWCLRAGRRGVPTWVEPAAVVRHEISRTTSTLPSAAIRYYAYRNLYRLAFRHAPAWAKPLVAMELGWTLAKACVRWAAFPAYRRDRWYHARTVAIRDALLGRWGAAPAAMADAPALAGRRRAGQGVAP